MDDCKAYVEVSVTFDADGRMTPRSIFWEDGSRFDIDRVLDVRPAPALRCGGQGDRYTVRIGSQQSYLYFERSAALTGTQVGRWFVERKRF